MSSPFLYFAGGRLSVAELAAARLDGDVVEVGEGFMPADAVETLELRAGSLAPLVGDTLAATHLSAAWVHGVLDEPPARHAVQRITARRLSPAIDLRVRYRDMRLPAGDIMVVCGAAVTTAVRTLADLVRSREEADRAAAERMASSQPALIDAALGWLADCGPVHDKRAAAQWLRERQEEVTR
ncbi:SAM-dependent methyltransferase [Microbacterium sp. Sa4CUA7]|uniref:SAM-dependent methyltransferase n=1 Tax=Microbacterium pullorum TaxID=2762236 RepID=A0ABR8S2Y4_9MICO|nr:SAM-dependent methyltransferase [Microbacterium pullorum]MBD7957837.1 SAM-dependent methyltransferase [Microbacterium pullorum]